MVDQAAESAIKSWTVPATSKAVRLDAFARSCLPHLSRRTLKEAVARGLFSIHGKTAKKGAKLKAGDTLVFNGPDLWLATQPAATTGLTVPIVYEDASVLVFDKPAGMATHGFSGRHTATLVNVLAAVRPELGNIGESRWELGLVHRLDRETSGLVMVAKTQAAFRQLRQQFRDRQVIKRYIALVWGETGAAGSIAYPLEHDPHDSRRMRAVVESVARTPQRRQWRAVTRFRKLGQGGGLSLLEVEMKTGVTHQIRVHLAAIGHPIVGDNLYGAPISESLRLHRHFLHAQGLRFYHPQSGAIVSVEAGLPGELQEVLDQVEIKH